MTILCLIPSVIQKMAWFLMAKTSFRCLDWPHWTLDSMESTHTKRHTQEWDAAWRQDSLWRLRRNTVMGLRKLPGASQGSEQDPEHSYEGIGGSGGQTFLATTLNNNELVRSQPQHLEFEHWTYFQCPKAIKSIKWKQISMFWVIRMMNGSSEWHTLHLTIQNKSITSLEFKGPNSDDKIQM